MWVLAGSKFNQKEPQRFITLSKASKTSFYTNNQSFYRHHFLSKYPFIITGSYFCTKDVAESHITTGYYSCLIFRIILLVYLYLLKICLMYFLPVAPGLPDPQVSTWHQPSECSDGGYEGSGGGGGQRWKHRPGASQGLGESSDI